METESLPAPAESVTPLSSSRPSTPAVTGTRAGWRDPGVLWMLASAAGFGAMAIFAKLAYSEGVTLPTLLTARFTLAAVLLWMILVARRLPWRVPLRTMAGLLVMGAVGYVGQSFSYFTALQSIPAATTGLLLSPVLLS